MNENTATPRRVIIRDLLIFQVKLLLDGFKDLVLSQISLVSALIDLLLGGRRRGRIFYGTLRVCERFDLWLNLYSAADRARMTPGGLLEERPRGIDSLLSLTERLLVKVWKLARSVWGSDPRRVGVRNDGSRPAAGEVVLDG